MSSKESEIRDRVTTRLESGSLLGSLLAFAHGASADVQAEFVDSVSSLAGIVRDLLESNGLIKSCTYAPQTYWPSVKGQSYSFVDAGVAGIDLPGAAPLGIRVGSYSVTPGTTGPGRERFDFDPMLVDDLYSVEAKTYDEGDELFDDPAKLRDAARMAAEVAGATKVARSSPRPSVLLVHGPLVNPVAPYGADDFPPFSSECCRDRFKLPASTTPLASDRSFVRAYRLLLAELRAVGVPTFGIVERAHGTVPVFVNHVVGQLVSDSIGKDIKRRLKQYRLNDTTLLDVVLTGGEYVEPHCIDRQGPRNKWPNTWISEIEKYPKAATTYLKPGPEVLPFRIESFETGAFTDENVAFILHTSRLLPSYGFPVGLDIVDKFAKVPAWVSRGVRVRHGVVLLRKAMDTGDPRVIAFAKRALAARGRDWFFRPEA